MGWSQLRLFLEPTERDSLAFSCSLQFWEKRSSAQAPCLLVLCSHPQRCKRAADSLPRWRTAEEQRKEAISPAGSRTWKAPAVWNSRGFWCKLLLAVTLRGYGKAAVIRATNLWAWKEMEETRTHLKGGSKPACVVPGMQDQLRGAWHKDLKDTPGRSACHGMKWKNRNKKQILQRDPTVIMIQTETALQAPLTNHFCWQFTTYAIKRILLKSQNSQITPSGHI